MELPDYKALKKLADACRKAGIKSFKGYGFEFTLAEDAPESTYKKTKRSQAIAEVSTLDRPFETDTLSEDALLFWSAGSPLDESKSE